MNKQRYLHIALSILMMIAILVGAKQSALAMPNSPVDETKVPHYYGPYSNYANSPFTLPDVSVVIDGDGTGATAEAVIGANGSITGINITDPGVGYTSATAAINSTNGSGASATAVVTLTGILSSVSVDAAGSGYTAPVVTISGGGATVDATATAYGYVDNILLDNPGSGYTFPTVDFDMPDDPNGAQAKAHVDMDPVTGSITKIWIDSPGSGYTHAPNIVIRDGTIFSPINHVANVANKLKEEAMSLNGAVPDLSGVNSESVSATATTTLAISAVGIDTYGMDYTSAPSVVISDATGTGTGALVTGLVSSGGVTSITVDQAGSGYITAGGIMKFQDGLPMLCDPSLGCTDNNLGQHIPLAVPDTTTFPGTDYYVIALVQHREQMSSSLPSTGTLNREYAQLQTASNASWSKHVALANDNLDPNVAPTPILINGQPALAVDDPHFMGPIIQAQKDRPVRVVFYNLLPTGKDGDLFLPVDTTFMGAGMGPMDMMMDPMDEGSVLDSVRNPACGEANRSDMVRADCFADTRATLHLHGGITPWISDGSPHQWITPANETTGYPQGVAVQSVPDMVGGNQPAGVPDCSADNDGCMTFYYTNQQSARLMFYHDHAWGITRLNVYAGEAAGYIIRDETEQALINNGLLPSGTSEIPLVVQDRTFVPSPEQMAQQDPTWDYTRWGKFGDLWYEHVYMPAQNPNDPTGMSAFGRWFYGPWFWPPATPQYGAINNPYYNMNPLGPDGIRGTADDWTTPLAKPCSLDDPSTWQYQTDPYCEPPLIPGTPNNSAGMEQFNDTPIVNGTAYPTLTVDPKAYRLRILNAANDRFFNFQWYIADPNSASTVINGMGEVTGGTEVALKAEELAAAQIDPNVFPTPDTSISPVGPNWIQIGTEGGFLPAPVVVPNQPITWITDPTRFDYGNVKDHSLLVAPAERVDVIVDFSQFAGQTLILYNDAPAAFPARIPCYDYYTGAPDMSPTCAASTLPGYGPNTRTVMQVKVSDITPPAPVYDLKALNAAFRHHADGSGVFESGQNPIIVGQAAYNSAYATDFAAGADCNSLTNPTGKCDGFARIQQQGGDTYKFDTLVGSQIGVKIEPKALHDETNSTNFEPYGRMSGNLGVEAVPATPAGQTIVLYPFVNPPTEIFNGTDLPTTDQITPISVGSDGTEIWKLTHNGVDTHPIHFHLYDVQLINRVTWDNIIIPPDASELGWKDTVRVSPLEDTYFAIRPIIPTFPFEIPNSIRPLNPMMPLGDTSMFNPTDPSGNPTVDIVNQLVNFGWEYMMHCHILSHEEMDMMRPVVVAMPPNKPDGLGYSISGKGRNTALALHWNDNSINETEFVVQRSINGGPWEDVYSDPSPLDQANTHGVRAFVDTSYRMSSDTYAYQVVANNTVGYGGDYPSMTVQSISDVLPIINPPSNLTATLMAGPGVTLSWADNTVNETGFIIERSTNGGATFTLLTTVAAHNNTGTVTYNDMSVTLGNIYVYRVAAATSIGNSAYSNTDVANVSKPVAPTNLIVFPPIQTGPNTERVIVSWTDNATNETGYRLEKSSDNFVTNGGTATLGANSTQYITVNIARIPWSFRVRAFNVLGSSAWVISSPIAPAAATARKSPLVFMSNFTNGFVGWNAQVGSVKVDPAASMGGDVSGLGMIASLSDDDNLNSSGQNAYVTHPIKGDMKAYMVNFYFNPNGALTSNTPVDIYTGLSVDGAEVFGIQFLHTSNAPTVYQIRGWSHTDDKDVYTDWVPIANAAQIIQFDWQSAAKANLNLYVDGNVKTSVIADTSEYTFQTDRFGPGSGAAEGDQSSAASAASGKMFFDDFVSLSPNAITSPFSTFMPLMESKNK